MAKYKINLKFKDNGKSLNEIIINALKIELEKQRYEFNYNYYSQSERNNN